jgi:eukaryotic-like serine/threonine-protein kinase
VLLYELLTGKTPFDAKELMKSGVDEMRRIICEQEPVRPSTRLTQRQGDRNSKIQNPKSKIENDLDWIVMKCLEKDRTRRYETANGLAADLKRYLDNEPVTARPPSVAYRFQKAFRRNKLAFGAGVAVVAALVVGLAVAAVGWRQTGIERDKALQAKSEAVAAQQKAETSQRSEQEQRRRAEKGEADSRLLLYAANMNLAQQAWEQNNGARLRQLLEETKESANRNFEWYYWQRQAHLELKTLRGHLEPVLSVAFSPVGQRIVTGSRDNSAKVWDSASGRELLTLKGHGSPVGSVAFSPDGQRIVTGSVDQTAKVWDSASGRELLTLKGHGGEVWSVAFSPDGQRIVTGSQDNSAKVWDSAGGNELLTLKGHGSAVRSVAFSPDGQRIVTSSWDQTAKVWDSASGKELLTLKGHGSVFWSVVFSPDGQRIVTGGEDNLAKIWEAASPNQVAAWQAEEHAAEQRLAQLRAAEASKNPESQQP